MYWKKNFKLFFSLMLVSSLVGCRYPKQIAKSPEMGNTNGNIINLGLVASQGNWLYISILSKDSGKLMKMRSDGTGITKLNDDECMYLNVVNDWIYYRNDSDNGYLYKIRTDGTSKTKLNDDECLKIIVIGDWIFCDTEASGLYKTHTDGSKRTFINNDVGHLYMNVVGDWIYCSDFEGKIYKISTDGRERLVWGGNGCYNLLVIGNWIYYCNFYQDHKLFKSSIDKFGETQLSDDRINDLNIAGDWLYYSNESDELSLYKVKNDGTMRTKLNQDKVSRINIIGEWIYYRNGSDYDTLYKIRTDGTGREKIDNQPIEETKKEEENPTFSYGEWELSKSSDYVYEYPTNKSQWVKDPYQELQTYKNRCDVGRRYLDINQDNIPELFLSWYGGTGGSNYVVYQITKGDYRFLGNLDFFPSPQVLPTKHNGFSDLIIFWRLGSSSNGDTEGVLSLVEFDGKKYNGIKEMNIVMEEAIQKKIFAPNTDKIFSHNYIADDDKETNKPWTIQDDDKYRRMIK